MFPLLSR